MGLLTAAAIGTAAGAAGVALSPVVLTGIGFTSAGIAAGSIAAAIQTPVTAAGGWFALCQSAGVLGLSASTQVGIGTAVGAATTAVTALFV